MEVPKLSRAGQPGQKDEEDMGTEKCPVSFSDSVSEGRVRRSVLTFPAISPEQLCMAKAQVEKAVKMHKVFSIKGLYPVVRAALRARGWIERRMSRPNQHSRQRRSDGCDDGDGSGGDDDDDGDEEPEKEEDSDDIYDLMSRMVRNEMTYLYWTTRKDAIDTRSLKKEQMTNHYTKSGSFTTKVGLCVNLRNLRWFDAADPDTFFPRCYRLGAEDEKQAFIEDFRRTACTSLLQCVVERNCRGTDEGVKRAFSGQLVLNQRKRCKRQALSVVPSRMIESALQVCQDYLNSFEHNDIDISLDSTPTLTDQQWAEFIHHYYLAVHEGAEIENCTYYMESCHSMLCKLRDISPQLDIDGIHNIWIIKPGAKSRGRGIICAKRLNEILKLVDSDPILIKDSKWVVQKYIERPFLIHGTKFDLRQWFLVTDWNPLTVWFYKRCYLRFSTQLYSVDTLESSVHLCNNSIQKHFSPSQQRPPEVPEDNMWSCGQFRSFLSSQGKGSQWTRVVVPGMKKAVIHALQTAQDLVEPRRGSFELYGADFMLGQDLHPWLIEINASPTMAPSTAVTAKLCAAVQEDTLRVVLDRRLDRGAHTGGFQLIFKQAAVEVPKYMGVSLLVKGSHIKRPRPPRHRSSNSVKFHFSHSGTAVPKHHPGKENDTSAEKPKPPSKRRIKAVVKEFTFSGIKPASVHTDCLADFPESWKPQRSSLGADMTQSSPRVPIYSAESSSSKPLNCSLASVRPKSGLVWTPGQVHCGPVLSLGFISFQDLEKETTPTASSPMVRHTGVQLQSLSRHHERRSDKASCTERMAHKV